jgi:hypothetical protein
MATSGALSRIWDQHLAAEFAAHSPEQALAPMTPEPSINVVALMVGRRGRDEVRDFDANHSRGTPLNKASNKAEGDFYEPTGDAD